MERMTKVPEALHALDRDLRELFGSRLKSVVAYSPAIGTKEATASLAIVDDLTADDLRACAARVAAWHEAGLDTPLLLAEREFGRSLDAFPLEFGSILTNHVPVSGAEDRYLNQRLLRPAGGSRLRNIIAPVIGAADRVRLRQAVAKRRMRFREFLF